MGKFEENFKPLSEGLCLTDREKIVYKLAQLDLQILLWDEHVLETPERSRVMETLAEQMHLRLMLHEDNDSETSVIASYRDNYALRFWDGAVSA